MAEPAPANTPADLLMAASAQPQTGPAPTLAQPASPYANMSAQADAGEALSGSLAQTIHEQSAPATNVPANKIDQPKPKMGGLG